MELARPNWSRKLPRLKIQTITTLTTLVWDVMYGHFATWREVWRSRPSADRADELPALATALNVSDDPEYWRKRAEETWSLAGQKTDADAEAITVENLPARSFPPPWSVEDTGATYVVKDSGGRNLAYVYYEEEAGRRSSTKILGKGEARRIATFFANLPELLQKE